MTAPSLAAWALAVVRAIDGILLLNLYAYITANPMALWTCSDPVGPDNDTHLRKTLTEQAQRGTPVVAGWGATATPNPNRAARVLGLVRAWPGTASGSRGRASPAPGAPQE